MCGRRHARSLAPRVRVIKGEYWEGALRLEREMLRGSGDDGDDDGGDCDGGAGGGKPRMGGGCERRRMSGRSLGGLRAPYSRSCPGGLALSCPVLSCPVLSCCGLGA